MESEVNKTQPLPSNSSQPAVEKKYVGALMGGPKWVALSRAFSEGIAIESLVFVSCPSGEFHPYMSFSNMWCSEALPGDVIFEGTWHSV